MVFCFFGSFVNSLKLIFLIILISSSMTSSHFVSLMTFLKVIGHNLRIKKNDKRSGDKKNYLKDKEK